MFTGVVGGSGTRQEAGEGGRSSAFLDTLSLAVMSEVEFQVLKSWSSIKSNSASHGLLLTSIVEKVNVDGVVQGSRVYNPTGFWRTGF